MNSARTSPLNSSHRSMSSLELFADGTTASADDTRAIDQPLAGTTFRRRSMIGVGKAKRAPVTVFADVHERDESVRGDNHRATFQGKALLSKPARRMALAGREQKCSADSDLAVGVGVGIVNLRTCRRRATIYIPEDTTVMTIHPGADNTGRLDDTFHPSSLRPSASPVASGQCSAATQPVRRSNPSLAAAPKRIPLQESVSNENVPGRDVAGCNTGKENIPPGAVDDVAKTLKRVGLSDQKTGVARARPTIYDMAVACQLEASMRPRPPNVGPTQVPTLRTTACFNYCRKLPSGTPLRTVTTTVTYAEPKKRQSILTKSAPPKVSAAVGPSESKHPSLPKAETVGSTAKKMRVGSFIASKRNEQQAAKVTAYPVLAGDLSQPELYENDWLAHQEIALTEIANDIFHQSAPTNPHALYGDALRQKLIEIYHQPDTALLHRRVQASLEYGALSPPKVHTFARDPNTDIGLRKHLVSLWLDSYNEGVLQVAAEVVAGRQIPGRTDGLTSSYANVEYTIDPHAHRRSLNSFLDLFFVCISDLNGGAEDDGARWRKMVSRGLMLILLLDQAKDSGFLAGCLFKSTSTRKTSSQVLDDFSGLLLPFAGEISRSLRHMGYEVAQARDPLDEVVYHVDNLATDLRNGILLTRLVEVLLCSHETRHRTSKGADDTLAIRLPDETVLLSFRGASPAYDRQRPLSKHLKVPCLGPAEKKFNIQLALSALESHSVDGINVVCDVSAKDILNGHREKTLSLLWQLVSIFGLEHLVDWRELKEDTIRCNGKVGITTQDDGAVSGSDYGALLQSWASSHAVQAGLPLVKNMTTAFVDGKVYAAILANFSDYVPRDNGGPLTSATSTKQSGFLRGQLSALGCSRAFANQIIGSIGTFTSREATISNLAFLASRLLPLARDHRAATTIQRAFRNKLARDAMQGRIRLEEAAVIIQRA